MPLFRTLSMVGICLISSFCLFQGWGCGPLPEDLELLVIEGTPDAATETDRPRESNEADAPTPELHSDEPSPPQDNTPDAHDEPQANEPTAAPDTDEFFSDAGHQDSTPDAAPVPDTPPPTLPTFPHFDTVIDLHRSGRKAWASFVYIGPGGHAHRRVSYGKTAGQVDFWPASTIKVYVATATLILLKQYGVSLDAKATFYYRNGTGWTKDITRTFRRMIHDSITCSSNTDYTLLLRFVGLDWLNTQFLTQRSGFTKTALMQGYVGARPYGYDRNVEQRIAIEDGSLTAERTHKWSKTSYANRIPCTVANRNGTANCTSPQDMTEHLRRLFFHEQLDAKEKWPLRKTDLDWFRYGTTGKPVLGSLCTKGGWDGIKKVLPGASYYHKPGSVTNYRSDMGFIDDPNTGVRYIFAIALQTSSNDALVKLSEEVARMALTPSQYVHLASLRDGVNPVKASLTIYTERPAILDLITKPHNQSPQLPQGWTPLPGTSTQVPRGISSHQLTSQCLSRSGKVHIVGRLEDPLDKLFAYSDLHFVVIDASVSCP